MTQVGTPDILKVESGIHPKSNYTIALVSLAVLYFMLGFITCMNDTLVPYFKLKFTLTYAESSLVQFYFFLTYGLVSIPAGRIIERVGYQRGMIFGFMLSAIGALLFFPASIFQEYYLFLAALFIIAIGIVFMQVAANPYIIILGPSNTASSRLNLIQGVGSVGTIVAPIFGSAVIMSKMDNNPSGEALSIPYLTIACILIVIGIVIGFLKLPKLTQREGDGLPEKVEERKSVFAFRNLRLGAIGIFFFVGIEIAIASFLTNYIADTIKIPESEANAYVAVYWMLMLIGRLIGVVLLRFVQPQIMLVVNACIAIALILISVNTDGYLAVWTLLGVGLFNSVMFAIIFTLSVKGLGNYITRASAILSTSICGGAVIVVLQGFLIDKTSWATAFLIPVICYLYLIFYGINGYKSHKNVDS